MNQQVPLFSEVPEHGECYRDYRGVPGLLYYPQLLCAKEQMDVLAEVDASEWRDDLSRRVQHYGFKYDYKARRVDHSMYVGPLPPFAVIVGQKLVTLGLFSELPDQLIVNEYQPGQGITPHIDCQPCFKDTIATVSLGSVYTMDLSEPSTGELLEVDLELGSCLIFSGVARTQWKHGIRARKVDRGRVRERRVSLTFRNVILAD